MPNYPQSLNIITLFVLIPCNKSHSKKNTPPVTLIHLINFNHQPIKINLN